MVSMRAGFIHERFHAHVAGGICKYFLESFIAGHEQPLYIITCDVICIEKC